MSFTGCRDFNNKCLAVGENITEGCITYKCNHQGDRIGLDAIATGGYTRQLNFNGRMISMNLDMDD